MKVSDDDDMAAVDVTIGGNNGQTALDRWEPTCGCKMDNTWT